jgi:hypothetical protein
MNERWRYQIKFGIITALFMTFSMIVFDEKSFLEQFNSERFYWRLLVNLLFGIFVFGYLFWKGKDEKNNRWSTFLKKNK